MEYIGGRTWQYDASFSSVSNVQFKFAANGSWTTNWGGSGDGTNRAVIRRRHPQRHQHRRQRHTQRPLSVHLQRRDARVQPGTVAASAYGSMYVPGTFDGWSTLSNAMHLISNDSWQCTIAFSSVTNVQFKFAANGNWTSPTGARLMGHNRNSPCRSRVRASRTDRPTSSSTPSSTGSTSSPSTI